MSVFSANRVRNACLGAGALLMAGCTVTPPPVLSTTVAPTPPLVQVPPVRPTPPFGASLNTIIPARDALGNRQTINTGITSVEALWNLRSAWNVAALNCLGPNYSQLAAGYRSFLDNNEPALSAANTALDQQFRTDFGGNYRRTRDTHSTRLYNYFALPPARSYFCNAALAMTQRYLAAQPADITQFALTELPQIDAAFDRFYIDFERYQSNVVNWDQVYGPEYGAVYRPVPSAPPIMNPAGAALEQSGQPQGGTAQ